MASKIGRWHEGYVTALSEKKYYSQRYIIFRDSDVHVSTFSPKVGKLKFKVSSKMKTYSLYYKHNILDTIFKKKFHLYMKNSVIESRFLWTKPV